MRKVNNNGILPYIPLKVTPEDKSPPTSSDNREGWENMCGSNGETWYMGNNSTQKGNLIQKHRLAENFKEHGELFRACHRPQACLTVPKWHTSLFWSSKSMKKSHSVLLSPLRSFTFLVPLHSLLMANFFLLVLKMFLCLFLIQRSSTEIWA